MSLAEFEKHLHAKNPAFKCFDCMDKLEQPIFLARIKNHINSPATPDDLSTIDQTLKTVHSIALIRQFYALHDGVRMCEDTVLKRFHGGEYFACGIEFFRVAHWIKKTSGYRRSFATMSWTNEEMPDWMRQAIVFGEICNSGNCFVIPTTGENAGKVIYADHDPEEPLPILGFFDDFLNLILADPARFMDRMGCYTRYSDGQTDTQWIPKEFVSS